MDDSYTRNKGNDEIFLTFMHGSHRRHSLQPSARLS